MKEKIKCDCGFEDEYESDEFCLSYYEAVGICPDCGKDLGTKQVIVFTVKGK